MAKEVRCIMFSPEEVRTAVAGFMKRQMPKLNPYALERIDLSNASGVVSAKVVFSQELELDPSTLDGSDMLAAVLLHCRSANIPLSRPSSKKLELVNDSLILTSSMNLKPAPPTVEGGAVVHTAGADKDFIKASRDHAAS